MAYNYYVEKKEQYITQSERDHKGGRREVSRRMEDQFRFITLSITVMTLL
jgi:hypothetical protein